MIYVEPGGFFGLWIAGVIVIVIIIIIIPILLVFFIGMWLVMVMVPKTSRAYKFSMVCFFSIAELLIPGGQNDPLNGWPFRIRDRRESVHAQ